MRRISSPGLRSAALIQRIAAATCLLLLLACSQEPGKPLGQPRPSPPGFINGGDCVRVSDPELHADAGCVTTVTGGDESLSVYAIVGHDDRPVSWRLNLTSPSGQIDQRLRAGNDFSYPRAVGSSDVDLDGDHDWWIKVIDYTSHGAPWSGLNLFLRQDSSLTPLTFEKSPLTINFGGITRLGEGADCRDGDLVLVRAEAQNPLNTRWSVSERRFSLRGTGARLRGRAEHLLVIEDYNDPKLDPYYQVECYGAVFTPFQGA